jgi:hypothetical protein
MKSQKSSIILRFAITLGLTAIPLKAHLQERAVTINPQTLDGPYSYRAPNDPTPIVGYVKITAGNGPQVSFQKCSGDTITVPRSALTHIGRSCPPGSPFGTWVASGGKIVNQRNPNVQISTERLPSQWQDTIRKAKPGEFVGVSQPGPNGSIDLSLVRARGS